jgi:hypothetical protein
LGFFGFMSVSPRESIEEGGPTVVFGGINLVSSGGGGGGCWLVVGNWVGLRSRSRMRDEGFTL